MMSVLTYQELLDRIDKIDPAEYARSRNFLNGAVTRLSPYISRGVIHTRTVYERVMARGYTFQEAEKLIQELAWRDYWQQVWLRYGDGIESDLKSIQTPVKHLKELPISIMEATTGISAVDYGIRELLASGYVHNHLRMYIASLTCNIAQCHWLSPARWMYYHLMDHDWASNALSWQWVAGAFSEKKYYCNQENINLYCGTLQRDSFLDLSYDRLPGLEIPESMKEVASFELQTTIPTFADIRLDPTLPLVIHTSYNLDPTWKEDVACNRVLLLEPSHFSRYPVSDKVLGFLMELAGRIPGIQFFGGEFSDLQSLYGGNEIHFRSHPFNAHFIGISEERPFLTDVKVVSGSFFKYWKAVKKELAGTD
ncbi:MAG: FAD-binding domain-containing protein [Bacteroidota bacterium]